MPRLDPVRFGRLPIVAAVAAMLAGLVVTAAVTMWWGGRAEHQALARLEPSGRVVVYEVQMALTRVETRVQAVAGLFRASQEVTAEEFRQFVTDVGQVAGMGGIGFAPVVPAQDLEAYAARMQEADPGYQIFGIDGEGGRVPLEPQKTHAPLQYFVPAEGFETQPLGFDLMSEPTRRAVLGRAQHWGVLVITSFLRLLDESDTDGLLAVQPVIGLDDTLQGFVVVPIDLGELLGSQIPFQLHNDLGWRLTDVNDRQSIGTGSANDPLVWAERVAFAGRVWRVDVTLSDPSRYAPSALDRWLFPAVGAMASLLLGSAVLLGARRLQVRRESDRLAAIAQAKDRFLATVSHELRTPLTAVSGFLDLVLEGEALSEAEKWELLGIAADQAHEMTGLVEDLITASRADRGNLAVALAVADVRQEVARVLATAAQGIPVDTGGGRGPALVWADPTRLRQILRNLITNAIRYGAPPVEIGVHRDGEQVRLQVIDHGPGVPPEQAERLFHPYHTAHPSTTQPESLGLGLWLSRQLARLMGGDLTYCRTGDRSIFELTLSAALSPSRRPAEAGDETEEPAPAHEADTARVTVVR